MRNRQAKIDALKRALGRVHQSTDHLNVACHCPDPSCPTSSRTNKLKLAIRLDDGRYHCWVCGTKGGNVAWLVKRFKSHSFEDISTVFPTKRSHGVVIVEEAPEIVQLPPGFELIASNLGTRIPELREVIKYVRERGFTDDDLWRYKLGFSRDEAYKNRVIIPSFDSSGDLNFFMSRAISRWTWPRYRNAPTKKHAMVFNELDIDWSNELVLTEGPFDTFGCPGNVACILGNTMTTGFLMFQRIIENSTPIVLALDAEERINTKKIARLLYSYNIPVRIMSIDGYKDLGEIPRPEITERIDAAKIWTPMGSLIERISNMNVSASSGSLMRY